jgi:hypothetical protein
MDYTIIDLFPIFIVVYSDIFKGYKLSIKLQMFLIVEFPVSKQANLKYIESMWPYSFSLTRMIQNLSLITFVTQNPGTTWNPPYARHTLHH